jgi:hypothetical protein
MLLVLILILLLLLLLLYHNTIRVELDVMSWDSEKRYEYSTEFCKEKNVTELAQVIGANNDNDTSANFVEKFNKFVDMDDNSLTKILTMQHVLQVDLREGGNLLTTLRYSSPLALQILQALQKMTMGITSAAGRGVQMHNQQHGHQHGPHCQHGSRPPPAHDVTTGITEKIER